jgi:hypothetical protein
MAITKYKLRCRKNGILVCFENELNLFDIVWKRIFNPEIYPLDK